MAAKCRLSGIPQITTSRRYGEIQRSHRYGREKCAASLFGMNRNWEVVVQDIVINTVGGPSDMDLFVHGLRDGGKIQFTLDFPRGKTKCAVLITGISDASGQREVWAMKGKIEISPENWVEFENALYSPKGRKGHFGFSLLGGEREEHPVCFHFVAKGTRRCPECGADRMDVG
jgi:hypothetical protein